MFASRAFSWVFSTCRLAIASSNVLLMPLTNTIAEPGEPATAGARVAACAAFRFVVQGSATSAPAIISVTNFFIESPLGWWLMRYGVGELNSAWLSG